MKRFPDARTLASVSSLPTSSITDLSSLYARVRRALPASPRFGRELGYRVFWLERGALRHRDVVAAEGGFAVLGRHSRAHVRLLDDPTVALRHAVLRAERGPSGALSLRMTDLLAPIGTCIEGDPEPRFSFVAEGEVCARVGSHAFCALPFDGCAPLPPHGGPGLADRPDPPPDDDDDDEAPRVEASSVVRFDLGVRRNTDDLVERRSWSTTVFPTARSRHVETLPAPEGPVLARVELLGQQGRIALDLGAQQLAGAVILGRYARCLAGTQVFSGHVSRMHLALTKIEGGVEVIDLASTQGVHHGGDLVHRVVIRDRAELLLAPEHDERVRIEVVGGGTLSDAASSGAGGGRG